MCLQPKEMARILLVISCLAALRVSAAEDYASNPIIKLFQEYIQINTTTHNDLQPAVKFWTKLAEDEGLPINVYEFVKGYPVIVIKWKGSNSSLPSIMLNSHMDVVPANIEDGWTYGPFSGYIDEAGDIYGRGTQDMKSVSIQHYEALRRLKANNETHLRDVYITLMPDEEVGADAGMKPFLKSDEFAAMNVGIDLDEGTPFDIPLIPLFYQDKVIWQIEVNCYGASGHGSTFPSTSSTATGKCRNVIDRLFEFRDQQYNISTTVEITDAGAYTSINLNKLSGGTTNNVIPSQVSLTFDIRLGTRVNENDFEATLQNWINEAGDNITLSYILKDKQSPATRTDSSNPYWNAIAAAGNTLNLSIVPTVPPGSTDGRHVRNAGYPAFGFSPMPNTPLLLHSVNERLNAATFLRGIVIFEEIIKNLANIPADLTLAASSTLNYYTS